MNHSSIHTSQPTRPLKRRLLELVDNQDEVYINKRQRLYDYIDGVVPEHIIRSRSDSFLLSLMSSRPPGIPKPLTVTMRSGQKRR